MSVVNLPDANTPIAWVEIDGEKIPANIDFEWMRGFTQLLDRTGGTTSNTIPELNIAAFEDAGIPEQQAELFSVESAVGQLPPMTQSVSARDLEDFRQLPPVLPQLVADDLSDSVSELQARVDVLESAIRSLMQGTTP